MNDRPAVEHVLDPTHDEPLRRLLLTLAATTLAAGLVSARALWSI
jgi:hypothetical protein